MSLTDILLTILVQVLFCAGLRVLMSEGQILYFLRRPFEFEDKRAKFPKWLLFINTPFVVCVVCFSSVWGGAVFIGLHGLLPIPLIICCTSTAFILKLINDKVDW